MKLPIYQVDAFSREPFHGNPAAVVILEDWLEDGCLQAIAEANNLSETTFVLRKGELFELRWFTPRVEVDLCGHATLAAAYVLFSHGFASEKTVRFETQSGVLTVARAGERLQMDFPARPPTPVPCSEALVDALGARPRETLAARDLMAVFDTQAEVMSLKPNFPAVAALDTFAVIATARGNEVDFVSRFFAPQKGIDEDPVTGSAHCALAPFWAERLGKTSLLARQLSPRGGEILCECRGDRVLLSGHAVEYLRGEIELPNANT